MRRSCKLFAACSRVCQPSSKSKCTKSYHYSEILVVVIPKNTSVLSAAVGRPPPELPTFIRPSRGRRHESRCRRESPDIEKDRRSAATVVADRRAPAARRRATVYHQRRPEATGHGSSVKDRSNLAVMSVVGH